MHNDVKISWSALEYEEKDRSADWFWALGVVVVTSVVTAIIFNNYFFAALLLISGGLLYFLAKKPPEVILYEITDKGIQMRSHFYNFKELKAFYVQKEGASTLFIKTSRFFLPIISVPTERHLLEQIQNVFRANKVPEQEMKEHPAEKIMESLGF